MTETPAPMVSVETNLAALDTVYTDSAAMRDQLAQKLFEAAMSCKLPPDDPQALQAQLAMHNAALKALEHRDAAPVRLITTKLRKTDSDRADQSSALVSDMLKQLATRAAGAPAPGSMAAYEQSHAAVGPALAAAGIDIPDTELRLDPTDVS